MDDKAGLRLAIEEAEKGLSEGGVPVLPPPVLRS